MSPTELRAAISLALIFFLRMLGLFLLLPVFSLAAQSLRGATPLLVGMAIGGYGLTQAIFQIPFGTLSDRYGRKPTITFGLLVFVAGSALAALSSSISGVILGRALQGAGAISASVMAMAADLTSEANRTVAMALIGMSIGLSFAAAFVVGPMLNHAIGLSGLFWASGALALAALAVLHWVVPDPPRSVHHRDCEAESAQLGPVLAHPELLRLNLGIFCLHMILTASFVAVPLALRDEAGLPAARHWHVYLPVLLVSVLLIAPFLRRADRGGASRGLFLGAVALIGLAEIGLWLGHGKLPELIAALTIFFTAFNFLEANLPALVSRAAPPDRKGTALGVYSTGQFLGTFLGGVCGGWLYGKHGFAGVFLFGAAVAAVWLLAALRMQRPGAGETYLLRLDEDALRDPGATQTRLLRVAGVSEAAVAAEERIAYLKVHPERLDRAALRAFSAADR